MRLFSAFSVGDFFPSLGWVDYLTGLIPEMKTTFLAVDAFLDEVIAEHESSNKKNDDFLGILLQLQECGRLDFQLDRDNLKAILVVSLFIYPSISINFFIYIFIFILSLYVYIIYIHHVLCYV